MLGAADGALFDIGADGALAFVSPPDYERPRGIPESATNTNVYEVTVRIESTNPFFPKPVESDYTVTVTDVDTEAPGVPSPEVSAVTETGFEVTWQAPANAGPPIEGYEVQYRRGYAGAFADAGHTGTGTSRRIDNLVPGAAYQVQVACAQRRGHGAVVGAGDRDHYRQRCAVLRGGDGRAGPSGRGCGERGAGGGGDGFGPGRPGDLRPGRGRTRTGSR